MGLKIPFVDLLGRIKLTPLCDTGLGACQEVVSGVWERRVRRQCGKRALFLMRQFGPVPVKCVGERGNDRAPCTVRVAPWPSECQKIYGP